MRHPAVLRTFPYINTCRRHANGKLKGPLGVTFRMLHGSCSPNLPSYFQMSHLMPPKQSLPHCPSVWAPFKIWLTPQLLTTVFQINFSNSVKCSSLWPVPKKPNSSGYCYEHLWGTSAGLPWRTRENNCYGTREQPWETWFKEEKPQVHWDCSFGSELVLS